jgi:hypothetical protein
MTKTVTDTCPCGTYSYTITYDSEDDADPQEERFCYFCGIQIETPTEEEESFEEELEDE